MEEEVRRVPELDNTSTFNHQGSSASRSAVHLWRFHLAADDASLIQPPGPSVICFLSASRFGLPSHSE